MGGIDGSGETTVASAFAERLRQEGFAVVVTAEPGGTPLGERLRQLLLREKPLSAWAEAFPFLAARAEHVAQVIRPALRQGETEWDEGITRHGRPKETGNKGISAPPWPWPRRGPQKGPSVSGGQKGLLEAHLSPQGL
ncbi:dTMP kinase [Thermus aquaticus]|uniref:dTMP kinase n=1 Tax=Thermus aquaticus TaxID=271 RepID=UPI003D15F6FA